MLSMQATSLFLSLLFAGIFIWSSVNKSSTGAQVDVTGTTAITEPKIEDRIGEVYGHLNPGSSSDPTVPPEPFAQLLSVIGTEQDRLKIKTQSVYLDGRVVTGEGWRSAKDVPNCVQEKLQPK